MFLENETFSARNLIKELIPILFGAKWFVKAYIVLLLFIPFLNMLASSIRRQSFVVLLAIFFFLFSLWPAFLPNPPMDDYGYSFVHLIFMYLIGLFLRDHFAERFPPKITCIAGYLLCVLLLSHGSIKGSGFAWAYNNAIVILEAVFLFMLFLQIQLSSAMINEFASCAFGVFLIHTSPFFNQLIYEKIFHASHIGEKSVLSIILTVVLCTCFFYLLGYVLERIKKFVFKPTVDVFLNRCESMNIKIENEQKGI